MLLCRHPGNTGRHIYCMWPVAVWAKRLSRHRSVWGICRYCVKAGVFSHLVFVGFVYEIVCLFLKFLLTKHDQARIAFCDIKALTWQSDWIISQHASDFLKTRSRLAASPPTGPLHGHFSVSSFIPVSISTSARIWFIFLALWDCLHLLLFVQPPPHSPLVCKKVGGPCSRCTVKVKVCQRKAYLSTSKLLKELYYSGVLFVVVKSENWTLNGREGEKTFRRETYKEQWHMVHFYLFVK